ncbi:hypothetical protein GTR04_7505 [Trichophyton interdigitale]|nr:hypothetical protein GY631_7500 [Trichophyton interdigitale]KAG5216526.1 hypothetical protein GY632_7465 [Trichophyton interdigitale]KAG8205111.1 hypothetical protein GTR04_7505 [Trichophyton interdigitale]
MATENGTKPEQAVNNENSTPDGAEAQNKDEQITVFHDPINFNVKHPLMNEWTLWFTKPPSGKALSSRATTGTICSRKSSLLTPLKNSGEYM